MKQLIFLCLICFESFTIAFSQMTPLKDSRIHSEGNFYLNNGVVYVDAIQVKFKSKAFDSFTDGKFAPLNKMCVGFESESNVLSKLNTAYGPLKIIKEIPTAIWGDTLGTNRITGEKVRLHDLSQVYMVVFTNPIPMDSVLSQLRKLPNIEIAKEPASIFFYDQPNDPYYTNGSQWNLSVVNAVGAWGITHGSSNVKIAIVDEGCLQTHEDLASKIVGGDGKTGQHGTWVAGVAAATTSNSKGVASLGWNTTLYTYGSNDTDTYIAGTITAAAAHCDIINMSWGIASSVTLSREEALCPECTHPEKWVGALTPIDDPIIHAAVENAVSQGAICVAGAGNSSPNGLIGPDPTDCDPWQIPYVSNPAAYPGVIAVSGTTLANGPEQFFDGWNYGSFVNVAGPADYIWTTDVGGGYYNPSGTSFSSPLVCALLSLMKAVNPNLSATTYKAIIDNTANEIDATRHPYVNGWNSYLGYGRVNAYQALKYELENYGGTVAENVTVPQGETWTFSPGITVTFQNGSSLVVNGNLSAVGTSGNPITFDFGSPNSSTQNGITFNGGGGTLSYCIMKNAYAAVYGNTSFPTIQYCKITNNTFGIYLNNIQSQYNGNWITNDTMTNNSSDGMILYNSSPTMVSGNTFSNNGRDGVYCVTCATPYIAWSAMSGNSSQGIDCESNSPAHLCDWYDDPGHCVLRNNVSNGIVASSSNVYLGGASLPPGENSITGNSSLCLVSVNGSHVSAEYNYWVPARYHPTFYVDGTSTLDASNSLSSDPNLGRQTMQANGPSLATATQKASTPGILPATLTTSAPSQFFSGDSTFWDSDLANALNSLASGKFDTAITKYTAKFTTETNKQKKIYELEQLAECYRSAKGRNFINFLNQNVFPSMSTKESLYAKALELEAPVLISDGEYDAAISNYITLTNNFPSDSVIFRDALFNLGYIYYVELKDTTKAKQYLNALRTRYPADEMTLHGEILMGEVNPVSPGASNKASDTTVASSLNFEIGNYPNPFNPTTLIRYNIPKQIHVTLKVYDILGREVATLVDGEQVAGVHEVAFDGSRFASGVYFYRLSASGVTQVKKMLMIK